MSDVRIAREFCFEYCGLKRCVILSLAYLFSFADLFVYYLWIVKMLAHDMILFINPKNSIINIILLMSKLM